MPHLDMIVPISQFYDNQLYNHQLYNYLMFTQLLFFKKKIVHSVQGDCDNCILLVNKVLPMEILRE